MKSSTRAWRILGAGVIAVLLAAALVRFLVVPAIIRGQLHARYAGLVEFRGWWLGQTSAGVRDLALGEGPSRQSPIWARAARVETDLSLGKLARGRFLPDRITLERPAIAFRIGEDGKPLTRPPLKGGGKVAALPEVVVRDGRITLAQEGRPEMTIGRVEARLASAEGGEVLTASTNDPYWGRWTAAGRFDTGFADGSIRLASDGPVVVTRDMTARIPFVPSSVWQHVDPRGPVAIALDLTTGAKPRVVTTCRFDRAELRLPTLGLVAEGATGTMVLDGGLVRLSDMKGAAIGGAIAAEGSLDFSTRPPKFDLALTLDGVDVARTPGSWQLAEAGLTGKLTGKVHLLIALTEGGADFTGSSGDAEVVDATVGGIPVKSLKIAMKAEGDDLKYETGDAKTSRSGPLAPSLERVGMRGGQGSEGPAPLRWGTNRPLTQTRLAPRRPSPPGGRGREFGPLAPSGERVGVRGWKDRRALIGAWTRVVLARTGIWGVAAQSIARPPHPDSLAPGAGWVLPSMFIQAPKPAEPPKRAGFVLPKSLSTQVEFADVDVVQVIAKANALGIPLPFAVAGKLSLKARATIPLGAIRDVKAYAFHGLAVLKGASIDGVDLGELRAKLDLENGVLDLTEFRGRMVDLPAGGVANPPAATDPVAAEGPLPPGGFRGRLHVEVSPPGRLAAAFEGEALPIGELAAPALPRPTPLSGAVTFRFEAGADVAHLDDLAAWTISGHAAAARLVYRGATLDRVATSIALKGGRLSLPDLAAALGKQPLKANLGMDVRPPYAFSGELDVAGWDLDAALAFVPAMPRPAPIGGFLSGATKARGTLRPLSWAIDGAGNVRAFRAGPIVFGDLPATWRTGGEELRIAIADARPNGGSIAAEARVPTRGGGPITGTATLKKIDVSAASGLAGGIPPMSGKVDGRGTFLVRPNPQPGEAAVEGDLTIASPELIVRGVPTRRLQAAFRAEGGTLRGDLYAEGLGGKMELTGHLPLVAQATPAELNGSLKAVGFRLDGLWKLLGIGGATAQLRGVGAIDANLRSHLTEPDLRARGVAEVRNLKWGEDFPLGTMRGNVTLGPDGWRVDKLSGDVVGGVVRGSASAQAGDLPGRRLEFNLDVDRASLKRALAFLPTLAERIDGLGHLRLVGVVGDVVRASGQFDVAEATLFGLPLQELRAPSDLEYSPNGGHGALRVRRWTARFAGGRITGEARFGVGNDPSFATETQIAAIDVENLSRVLTAARRPASGKVSGKVTVNGAHPGRLEGYRGRVDLDLDAASLIELPVFREFERFLGSASGGTFDDGALHATIGNRQLQVESLTLEGRIVQLHGSGTIGFDQRLDLEVLINTNEIIGQTGQALVAVIPGLSEALGRRGAGIARVANYLQNRLLKFRVTGTIANPSVNLDPAIAVTEGAVGFFGGVFKLPLELIR